MEAILSLKSKLLCSLLRRKRARWRPELCVKRVVLRVQNGWGGVMCSYASGDD